jgi:hypothetical protein
MGKKVTIRTVTEVTADIYDADSGFLYDRFPRTTFENNDSTSPRYATSSTENPRFFMDIPVEQLNISEQINAQPLTMRCRPPATTCKRLPSSPGTD